MSSKSKSQQKFFGQVHAAQKGELNNPSEAVKKAAKSMKKKDVKDFASTKHKGLPEKVKETFVPSSLSAFLKESIEEPNVEFFIDSLLTVFNDRGLTDQEADFVMGELDEESIQDWARDFEMNARIIDPLADSIIKDVFQKDDGTR